MPVTFTTLNEEETIETLGQCTYKPTGETAWFVAGHVFTEDVDEGGEILHHPGHRDVGVVDIDRNGGQNGHVISFHYENE